MILAHHYRNNI